MSDRPPQPRYPWAELYDIESGIKQLDRARRAGTLGPPPKPFKRSRTSVTLTSEERRMYDRMAYELGSKMHPNRVTKSQVVGLALRLLQSRFEALPEQLDSWEALAEILFEGPAKRR